MYTSNNQNLSKLLYNGPHRIRSTSPMGFSITVNNIPFEKKHLGIINTNDLSPLVDNIPEMGIEHKQEQSKARQRNL